MKYICSVLGLFLVLSISAQEVDSTSIFWKNVRWGGTAGANFSNEFTNISVSPQAVYQVNSYFSTGVGLHYSYFKRKNIFTSHAYGASFINFFNPIPEAQISAELEQLRINNKFSNGVKDDFWNTALFLGVGYRQQNLIIGVRYNVLFKRDNNVYAEAWAPFIRVFF